MSLRLSFSPGDLTSMTGFDGTLFLYGKDVSFEISPEAFCGFVEGFLYHNLPSASTAVGLLQMASDKGVELCAGDNLAVLTLEDYVCLVKYFFTNTDLRRGDPRLAVLNRAVIADAQGENEYQKQLFDWMITLQTKPGWNVMLNPASDCKRLA